jgi:DNA-3-methyladenine glycosylase
MLSKKFFDRDAKRVAQELLGKIIRVKQGQHWLAARIIETEAYYLAEKASHASLGFTEKRKALFMPAGTIYMYYSRAGDSLNISCHGEGNAVLIKSAIVYQDSKTAKSSIEIMRKNLLQHHRLSKDRPDNKLCSGQTLLCRSLGLKVPDWNQKTFTPEKFYFEDMGFKPQKIIRTTRLGIPKGRDEDLHYRFLDYDFAASSSSNPLTKRHWQEGVHYKIIKVSGKHS